MNQLANALRDLAEATFSRLAATYPDEKVILGTLRTIVLAGVSRNSSDVAALEAFVDSIQDEGGKLDVSGEVYADLFDFQDELRKFIRETLSEDPCCFPQLSVQLKAIGKTKVKMPVKTAMSGERTKLGGKPDWIQGEETPICKRCRQPMTFVGQIDSIGAAESPLGHSLNKAGAFLFADCGMIFVFWCRGCNDTRSVLQCY